MAISLRPNPQPAKKRAKSRPHPQRWKSHHPLSRRPTCTRIQSDSERLEPDSEVSAGSSRDFWRPLPTSSGHRLLFADSDDDDDEDEEDDEDGVCGESEVLDEAQWKRQIQVGPDHQANVPDGVTDQRPGSTTPPYEEADVVLWDPSRVSEQEVETYLSRVRETWDKDSGPADLSTAELAQREFDALSLLHECEYKTEDAMARVLSQAVGNGVPSVALTAPEIEGFEDGLKVHGKDFHAIHKHQVPSRSVRELVQYYYTWKMSERFKLFLQQLDYFTTKFRTDKRKFRSAGMNDDNLSVEDTDGSVHVMGPTAKSANSCPSHSMIPFNYGQSSVRTTVTSISDSDSDLLLTHPHLRNGLLKSSDEPPVAASSLHVLSQVQTHADDPTSASSSASVTRVPTSVSPDLEVCGASESGIDCK